ncbi:uncharacterized protein [Procambarus clarkii]|uniref:uncharacterized protein n=1 Tax=Procambarus clarkii TaxID=6728 RepID=UPI001E678DF5|nr:uncharacterized protein LOC123746355 [Procambarus clarkii]XP_045583779.1 uncharacterized protein LOC123746355 [Procambarus clarkii]
MAYQYYIEDDYWYSTRCEDNVSSFSVELGSDPSTGLNRNTRYMVLIALNIAVSILICVFLPYDIFLTQSLYKMMSLGWATDELEDRYRRICPNDPLNQAVFGGVTVQDQLKSLQQRQQQQLRRAPTSASNDYANPNYMSLMMGEGRRSRKSNESNPYEEYVTADI